MKCQRCADGPRDIDGHEHLDLAEGKTAAPAPYQCKTCGTVWSRSYEGSATFVWIDVTSTA